MNRKDFLNNMAAIATIASLPKSVQAFAKKKHSQFGIQLWSIKEDMDSNVDATLKQLSKIGYQQIESFDGKQGMFWGKSPKEFVKFLKDLNMTLISSHVNIKENFEQKVIQAAEAGIKYLICPWLGPQKSIDEYKMAADSFNKCGEICKKNGLKFAYHNHAYSFELFENQFPQDVLMKQTDFELVNFEMDIYWVVVAGQNPIEWLKKYPNRFKLCHIKDREKNATNEDRFASCTLGTGSIDYAKLIPQIKDINMKYFIVEQEKFAASTPLLDVEKDFKMMKKWM